MNKILPSDDLQICISLTTEWKRNHGAGVTSGACPLCGSKVEKQYHSDGRSWVVECGCQWIAAGIDKPTEEKRCEDEVRDVA